MLSQSRLREILLAMCSDFDVVHDTVACFESFLA